MAKSRHKQHQNSKNAQPNTHAKSNQRQQDLKWHTMCAKKRKKKQRKMHDDCMDTLKAKHQRSATQQPGTSTKNQRGTAKHMTTMPTRQGLKRCKKKIVTNQLRRFFF